MNKQRKTALKLVGVALGMFAFAFALVPLYDVICDITGLNGKTSTISQAQAEQLLADPDRTINVQFITTRNQSIPLEFEAQKTSMAVKLGEVHTINYRVRNLSNNDMVAQAVPSLTPALAASYFNKIECFCFDNQTIKAGEEKMFEMRFVLNPQMPAAVQTVTLAYTFFDVSGSVS